MEGCERFERVMPKRTISREQNGFAVAFAGCCLFLLLIACSKSSDPTPAPVPTPPVNTNPTGVIGSFTVNDTLIAYKSGTTLHWLVNNTNNYTVVTVNGIKVTTYGSWDTGPLTDTTGYVLAVNNGLRDSLTVKVADSIISALWNSGKRLKIVKREYWAIPNGATDPVWVDTTAAKVSAQVLDQRLYVSLTGSTNIIQLTSGYPAPGYSGRITTQQGDSSFSWNSRTYSIDSLTDKVLLIRYNTPVTGSFTQPTRDRYLFE
jgi:hypothetical protein